MKLKGLEKARQNFEIDLLNDTGIMNLLRKMFLSSGDIEKVVDYYQETRLEPESPRYESLLGVLVITIVGSVVSGIILDIYKDFD